MTNRPVAARDTRSSLREYGRGLVGGLLFSLPLIYTAEVWRAGEEHSPWRLLVAIAATFGLLFGYNRYAGLHPDASWTEVVIDSFEEAGIGLLLAALLLWLLGQLDSGESWRTLLGKITVEGMVSAIGVSIGTAQLGGDVDEDDPREQADDQQPDKASEAKEYQPPALGEQAVLAACGGVILAANMAPTEEIRLIASNLDSWRLLGLVVLSLLLCATALFYSDKAGNGDAAPSRWEIAGQTLLVYVVALMVSAGWLWFFSAFDGQAPIIMIAQTVVLGVAATVGAAVGRLLLK